MAKLTHDEIWGDDGTMVGRVTNIHEEFSCDWCGCPVVIGDVAIVTEPGKFFCSHTCRNKVTN